MFVVSSILANMLLGAAALHIVRNESFAGDLFGFEEDIHIHCMGADAEDCDVKQQARGNLNAQKNLRPFFVKFHKVGGTTLMELLNTFMGVTVDCGRSCGECKCSGGAKACTGHISKDVLVDFVLAGEHPSHNLFQSEEASLKLAQDCPCQTQAPNQIWHSLYSHPCITNPIAMVVAQVVRIRNHTLRTFRIAGATSSTRIDGETLSSNSLEVAPGSDYQVEGLEIPWASVSKEGLVITEVDTDQMIRWSVGPKEGDSDSKDFLRWHNAAWQPINLKRWINVGKKHLMGALGGSTEWQITFRQIRKGPAFCIGDQQDEAKEGFESEPTLEDALYFDRADSKGLANTVFLNVFDLAGALSWPNAILCNPIVNTIGAFHAAIEVYGEEWSFYRTPSPVACGVHKSTQLRNHPVHVYRESIDLGKTVLKSWEVRYLIRAKLSKQWPGGTYDLLHRNCIHFCDELSLSLGVKSVPAWVRRLHETGASVLGIPWPVSYFLSDGEPAALENDEKDDSKKAAPESSSAAV